MSISPFLADLAGYARSARDIPRFSSMVMHNMRVCVPMDFKADALNLVVVGVGLGLADCTFFTYCMVCSLFFYLSLITLIARSAQSVSQSVSTPFTTLAK